MLLSGRNHVKWATLCNQYRRMLKVRLILVWKRLRPEACTKKLRNIYVFHVCQTKLWGNERSESVATMGPLPESPVNKPIRLHMLTAQRLPSNNQA